MSAVLPCERPGESFSDEEYSVGLWGASLSVVAISRGPSTSRFRYSFLPVN